MKTNVIYPDDLPLIASTIQSWLFKSHLVDTFIGISAAVDAGYESIKAFGGVDLVLVHSHMNPLIILNLKDLLKKAEFCPRWMTVLLGKSAPINRANELSMNLQFCLDESECDFQEKLSWACNAENKVQINAGPKGRPALTEFELSVFELVIKEKSSSEIGDILYKSKRTIEGVRRTIMKKIGVNSPIGMVKWWYENRIIP